MGGFKCQYKIIWRVFWSFHIITCWVQAYPGDVQIIIFWAISILFPEHIQVISGESQDINEIIHTKTVLQRTLFAAILLTLKHLYYFYVHRMAHLSGTQSTIYCWMTSEIEPSWLHLAFLHVFFMDWLRYAIKR